MARGTFEDFWADLGAVALVGVWAVVAAVLVGSGAPGWVAWLAGLLVTVAVYQLVQHVRRTINR